MISVFLLTLHAYSPIFYNPKLSSSSPLTGLTVPAKYYHNVTIDDTPVEHDEEHVPEPVQLANATFLILSRNEDVDRAVATVKQMADRFNHVYHYPWVFLNEQPFSEDFKR